jgi:Ras-related protein Rab-21
MENEVKIVTLGEGRVGKTSLMLKFVHNVFHEDEAKTINANYLEKALALDSGPAKLNIWDTAGQERFRAIAPIYYQQAKGAIVVYDITDKSTFDRVVAWVAELKKFAEPDIVIVIAGNKCDMESRRKIPLAMAVEYAKSVNAQHFNTSAKTGRGIEEMFTAMARAVTSAQSVVPVRRTRMTKKVMVDTSPVKETKATQDKEIRSPSIRLDPTVIGRPKKKCC